MNSYCGIWEFLCLPPSSCCSMGHYGRAVQKQCASVLSAPEVGWSVMIQYSVCSSLICSPSTLSLSKVFHFLIVYLWQQKQPTTRSPYTDNHLSFCIYEKPKSMSLIYDYISSQANNRKHRKSNNIKKIIKDHLKEVTWINNVSKWWKTWEISVIIFNTGITSKNMWC